MTDAPEPEWEPPHVLDQQAAAEADAPAPRRLAAVPTAVKLHDTRAEQALLGAALTPSTIAAEVISTLEPAAFYTPSHALIADAIQKLHANDDPTDAVTVIGHLDRHALLDICGGPNGVIDVQAAGGPQTSAARHSRTITGLHQLRTLQAIGAEITQLATQPAAQPGQAAAAAQDLLDRVHDATAGTDNHLTRLGDGLDAYLDALERRAEHGSDGLLTAWPNFDKITGGLHPGSLTTIAARPGMGKSDVATHLARNIAGTGAPVLFVSIEMSTTELNHRWVAAEAEVTATDLTAGTITPADWKRIAPALTALEALPLHVDDDPAATLASIRAAARRTGARLVIVDYLQLIEGPAAENRQVQVTAIARGLKRMARQMQVPVVALAQLNRNLEQRGDKRPVLSDLRESGAIEQESDLVVGLYRDEIYHSDTKSLGVLELIVLKNRAGATGAAYMQYDPARKGIRPLPGVPAR